MATNGKKSHVPAGLPQIPKRLRVDDPLEVRKTMFGLNCSRDGLEFQIKQLETNLKQYAEQIGRTNLKKFNNTLKDMRKASSLIRNIGCVGPYMSFEFSYLTGKKKAAKIRARRRR